jgi:2-oxoglutarate ferredoxin oxidoreductase subunit alpha
VLQETVRIFKDKTVGFVHLPQVWPFPAKDVGSLLSNINKIITVENNASGQLRRLIRRETGIDADSSILKFEGRPFDLDSLAEQVKREV